MTNVPCLMRNLSDDCCVNVYNDDGLASGPML